MTISTLPKPATPPADSVGGENIAEIVPHPKLLQGLTAKQRALEARLLQEKQAAVTTIEHTISEVKKMRTKDNTSHV